MQHDICIEFVPRRTCKEMTGLKKCFCFAKDISNLECKRMKIHYSEPTDNVFRTDINIHMNRKCTGHPVETGCVQQRAGNIMQQKNCIKNWTFLSTGVVKWSDMKLAEKKQP